MASLLKLPMAIALSIGILISVIASANANCEYTDWGYKETPCPAGFVEIFTQKSRVAKGQSNKLCCTPETAEAAKGQYGSCLATRCGDSSSPNLCAEIDERFIDGKQIMYGEEISRDQCEIRNGGGIGAEAICCPQDSLESALASTLGAEQHEYPHQAKLKMPGNCGGTVYNKRWIVTAAHCFVDDYEVADVGNMKVILGTNNGESKDVRYVYNVVRAIPHERYSALRGSPEFVNNTQYYNDIGLLEVDRDIKFSDTVKSLEIAPKNFDPFKYAGDTVIVGWGTTDTLAVSINLQRANFILRSDQTCFEYVNGTPHPFYHFLKEQLLCVGGIRDGKWSPTAGGGDSGGPAICRGKDGKAVLCGVTSFGGSDKNCSIENNEKYCEPSVYAEVAYFHDWIKGHAGPQDPSTFYKPYVYGQPIKADHQVHITSRTGKPCGGTLVAPDIVVTAAQCVLREDHTTHSGLKFHYGVTDLKSGDQGQVFTLKDATMLPTWKNTFKAAPYLAKQDKRDKQVLIRDDIFKDDVAVVKLNKKTPINPSKIPALPGHDDQFRQGREISLPRNTTLSGEMRARDYKLLSRTECQKRMDRLKLLKLNAKIDDNVLCGVEKYSGGSQCDRELGGGLICQKGGKDVLCGVQVFRMCVWSIPNGFMNMGLYGDWVKQAIKSLK